MNINNFKEPLEPELSLTIERLNKFLNSHSFNITYPFDVEVKINVTNIKPMITIGEWSDVIEYTISLEKTQDVTGKIILNHLSKIEQTQDYSIKRGEHKNTYFVLYEIQNSMNGILREFLKYFNINKKLIFNHWFKFCKTKKMPVNYTKFRFNGEGRVGFLKQLKMELKNKNITFDDIDFVYDKKDKNRCKNLSKSIIGRNWYNDGKNNYMLYSDDSKITILNLKKGLLKYVKN